jgi:X-X-X-Leu-X-X-Gly heptad repeat protein
LVVSSEAISSASAITSAPTPQADSAALTIRRAAGTARAAAGSAQISDGASRAE